MLYGIRPETQLKLLRASLYTHLFLEFSRSWKTAFSAQILVVYTTPSSMRWPTLLEKRRV